MKKVTNQIRSKVLKAAWTTYGKRSNWSFSTCLKNAWKWAKETLLSAYTIWMPRSDFGRVYFSENQYMQFSIKEKSPKGYYENHRYCKGESFAVAYYKLVEITVDEISEMLSEIAFQIAKLGQNIELIPSKF